MVFNGLFNLLDVTQTVALFSCFVFDEKSSKMPRLSASFGLLKQMQDLARRIAQVSLEAKLELEEHSYVTQFKLCTWNVLAAWRRGATFGEICNV
jgi:ATP-dependent RNA helicase DOB1